MEPRQPESIITARATAITGAGFVLFQYDVTADGSRFVVNSLRPEAPLTLIADWTAELQRGDRLR